MAKRKIDSMKGDGLRLFIAVRDSGKNITEITDSMNIVKQTLYNYYDTEILSEDIKDKASIALSRNKESIFGHSSNNSEFSNYNLDKPQAWEWEIIPSVHEYLINRRKMGDSLSYIDTVEIRAIADMAARLIEDGITIDPNDQASHVELILGYTSIYIQKKAKSYSSLTKQ